MWPDTPKIPRMVWALRFLGYPINKIVEVKGPFYIQEDLLAEIEASPSGSIIMWDDVGHWLAPPRVGETWAFLEWWFFQRWAI